MSRKGHIKKRDVNPDPIYNSKLVTKVINVIMQDGKKGKAQTIFYQALKKVQLMTKREPLEVFRDALNNIMPVLEVRTRRVGGQNYQVPSEIRPERRQSLGLKWLVKFTKQCNEKTMKDKLAKEIVDASLGHGVSVKKREETHRMAEANKAFAHYRW
ncbi:30S ribosomal protein S7 [Candidatus Phytoplasma australiense]|uniref:Small ribosomal subunit protein uS7 n=1 Tax=Phytoplasma australiense TaxID=59748 RepID=RS7_PHYAS|nr:RecName: Full=Small ribosomal subunit protein uS7; AltName: Full=30S ribosomal protein S7 [Candidatus Phytoplasma australiense]CAM11996.1 30S ribosomal protein S7 [Candidatus Phytoplasma australiense]